MRAPGRGALTNKPAQAIKTVLPAPVDRDDAPAIVEAVDLRQRQRIDHKAQRGSRRKVERDGQHRADRAGMHDQDHVARRQCREAVDRAADLIDKTLPARRAVARRRFPEIPIDIAEFCDKIVMPSSGPRPEILFAKGVLLDGFEPERGGGLPGPPRRAANRVSLVGNPAFSAAKAAASLISAGASGPWITPRGPSTGA